jgi:hypothetical protein
MYFRDHVEEIIIRRLLDHSRDKKEVSNIEFDKIVCQLRLMMEAMAKQRKILGFTSEDLYSFEIMKLHQILRRNQYNPIKSHHRLFIIAFNNLFNDINRLKNNAFSKFSKYYSDPIDECVSLKHPRVPKEFA